MMEKISLKVQLFWKVHKNLKQLSKTSWFFITGGRFFQNLWPSHSILTLQDLLFEMWFQYQLHHLTKLSANLGLGFGIGPKPKKRFLSYTSYNWWHAKVGISSSIICHGKQRGSSPILKGPVSSQQSSYSHHLSLKYYVLKMGGWLWFVGS